jgi:hypothetical protein
MEFSDWWAGRYEFGFGVRWLEAMIIPIASEAWHAAEVAQKSSDEALLQNALLALEYHREQTRPIQRTTESIVALRARLSSADTHP